MSKKVFTLEKLGQSYRLTEAVEDCLRNKSGRGTDKEGKVTVRRIK